MRPAAHDTRSSKRAAQQSAAAQAPLSALALDGIQNEMRNPTSLGRNCQLQRAGTDSSECVPRPQDLCARHLSQNLTVRSTKFGFVLSERCCVSSLRWACSARPGASVCLSNVPHLLARAEQCSKPFTAAWTTCFAFADESQVLGLASQPQDGRLRQLGVR